MLEREAQDRTQMVLDRLILGRVQLLNERQRERTAIVSSLEAAFYEFAIVPVDRAQLRMLPHRPVALDMGPRVSVGASVASTR